MTIRTATMPAAVLILLSAAAHGGEPAPAAPAGTLPADYAEYVETEVPDAPSGWALLGRLAGSLVVVLGLIVVSAYVFKRMLSRSKLVPGGGLVEVLQALPLGGKRQIYLVKIAGRVLVVGASGEQISLLAELPEGDIVARAETLGSAMEQSGQTVPGGLAARHRQVPEFLSILKSFGRRLAGGGCS